MPNSSMSTSWCPCLWCSAVFRFLLQFTKTSIKENEVLMVMWSSACMFSATAVVYIVSPLRDTQALTFGQQHLPTLIAISTILPVLMNPAVSWLFGRSDKSEGGSTTALVHFYRFLICTFAGFAALELLLVELIPMAAPTVACVFYLWASVVSTLLMSLSWGHVSEIFTADQALQVFGLISASCTGGQLLGSTFVIWASKHIAHHTVSLLVVVAGLLEACARAARRMRCTGAISRPQKDTSSSVVTRKKSLAGHWSGLTAVTRSRYLRSIFLYTCLQSATTTLIYLERVSLMQNLDAHTRSGFSARLNACGGIGTLTIQVLLASKLSQWLGVQATLLVLPIATCLGAGRMLVEPCSLEFIALIEILRKVANYAVTKPVREALFSVVTQDERYSCKTVIDTFAGKCGSGCAVCLFLVRSLSLSAYRAVFVALVALWIFLCPVLQSEMRMRTAPEPLDFEL